MTLDLPELPDQPMRTPPDRRPLPPKAPRPLKYGWAMAISAMVALSTFAQLQYPGSALHHCSRLVLELLQTYAPGQDTPTAGEPQEPPAPSAMRH